MSQTCIADKKQCEVKMNEREGETIEKKKLLWYIEIEFFFVSKKNSMQLQQEQIIIGESEKL